MTLGVTAECPGRQCKIPVADRAPSRYDGVTCPHCGAKSAGIAHADGRAEIWPDFESAPSATTSLP